MMSQLRTTLLAAAAGLVLMGSYGANAAPITLDPSGSVPPLSADPAFQTDNATIGDNAVIQFDAAGNFVENGIFKITSFNLGLTTVSSGVQTNYNIYGTFTATGSGFPNATIDSFTFTLFGDPDADTIFPTSGLVLGGDTSDDFVLATGSLDPSGVNQASVINPLSTNPVLTFNVLTTFNPDPLQAGFFVSPDPFLITLEAAATATSRATTSTCPAGPPCTITINGGGGNISFLPTPVPEPASLGILGAGLVALGLLGWRRRKPQA